LAKILALEFQVKSVKSKDGTTIGFRQTGAGQGLIICHGAGRISQNYEKLAIALSHKFTVYIPDRRGRGLSGPAGDDYNMEKAVEDLTAVIKETKVDFIFGHSAGGLVALETALLQPITKLALYEPPVSVNNSIPNSWLPAFEKALSKNQPKKSNGHFIERLKSK
jgi:pimeloyl-ACP methyl ester carboxylesterase